MPEPTSKYLNPADLQRLRHVVFATRRPVDGLYAGRHVSRQRGHSVEFTDYRQYFPGDEIGDIDWKVFGRSDRLFIKRFEHQSDMNVHVLLDASASMDYPGDQRNHRKFDAAARIAAAVAFLVLQQQDKVSLGLAQGGLKQFLPPRSSPGHLQGVLGTLEGARPQGLADLPRALDDLGAQIGRRGVVIVLSDLLDDQSQTLTQFNALLARGLELIVFHVLHPDELTLPEAESARFTDAETGQQLTLQIDDIREDYTRRMREFTDGWAAACRSRGIDHHLVRSDQPYYAALERHLFRSMATR